jgi:CRP-like cAMP-binding protein
VTTPKTARLLALWCDPERTDERLQALARAVWRMDWPGQPEAFAALLASPHDTRLRAAARYAERETGTAVGVGAAWPLPLQPSLAEEEAMLATIERVIFLKEVPFFEGMTVEQLKILAEACEEELVAAEARIFSEGDPGGVLYVVVSGKVALEQEKRKGSFARLATIEAGSYFGEMNLFDNSPRSTCASAVQDSILLRLDRDPLIALARRYPDLSLALVNVLSVRLRETQDRIAELTRTRPEKLHRLYDQLG